MGWALGAALLLAIALLNLGQPKEGWWRSWFGDPEKAPIAASGVQPSAPKPVAAKPGQSVPLLPSLTSETAADPTPIRQVLSATQLPTGHPEQRLVEIYASIEAGDMPRALRLAQSLVKDHPNFQLAHLVHGDLLQLRYRPTSATNPAEASGNSAGQLAALRAESRMRLDALRNRPAPGTLPRQLLATSPQTKHVIAIDASRGRLYWFENTATQSTGNQAGLKLVSDFFISVGKSGIRKQVEGDGRTPLGVYHVTSIKDRKSLPEFYGSGALPLNYPNAFDIHRGRTGSGIWLHGTPPNQFVRAPLASDGCVVLANPDMQRLLEQVAPKSTPVVIAEKLDWVDIGSLAADRQAFEGLLQRWQKDRAQLSAADLNQAYLARPTGLQKVSLTQPDWTVRETAQLGIAQPDLVLTNEPEPGLVATFEETEQGQATGVVRRQYWTRQDGDWRLVQDSVVAGSPSSTLKRLPPKPIMVAESSPPADRSKAPGNSELRSATGKSEEAGVQAAVQAWSKAWTSKNMGAYLKAYDSTFDPPGGASRKAWEKDRTDRILGKSSISLKLQHMKIRTEGDRATVTFLQQYKADHLEVSGRKTLRLVRRGNEWRITHESVG